MSPTILYRALFIRRIRSWFQKHGRSYPWRETHDPYKILVSEYLLQQTNADLALPTYRQFLVKYPTVSALAQANLRSLNALVKPIGLAYRAVRLRTWARQVVQEYNGRMPSTREDLLRLHGVGLYMSNAVRCFAYNERVPILDTNTIRIFERIFGIKSNLKRPRTDKILEERMKEYLPKSSVREFNYALLDFGALACTFKNPKCSDCPLNQICKYYKSIKEDR